MTTGSAPRDGLFRPTARRRARLALPALVLIGALLPLPALADHWAPPPTVYVPRTGHTADRLFLQLWMERAALLGDPITEEFTVQTGLGADPEAEQVVQYYENAALVYLPEEAPEAQVQLLPLGRDALDRALAEPDAARALRAATRRTACGPATAAGCAGFAETGHTVRGELLAYWEEAGGQPLLGLPLTEAFRAGDGSWVQYFERAVLRARPGGGIEPLPIGRVAAERRELATERIVRPADIPLFWDQLFIAPPEPEPAPEPVIEEPVIEEPVIEPEPAGVLAVGSFGPGPQQGGYQEIVVSISAQALWAYENGELVMSTYVSTGTAEVPETVTPIGYHSILSKYDVQTMEGTISNEYYNVPDVPHVMYFDNLGNALHGTYWHANFGAPMSHGCVNLPLDVAAWIYAWAPVGTPVTVIG